MFVDVVGSWRFIRDSLGSEGGTTNMALAEEQAQTSLKLWLNV